MLDPRGARITIMSMKKTTKEERDAAAARRQAREKKRTRRIVEEDRKAHDMRLRWASDKLFELESEIDKNPEDQPLGRW